MEDDTQLEENPSSRILGIGAGVFTIAVLFFSTVLVWIFTSPSTGTLKTVMRSTTVTISLTAVAILLLAERQDQYTSTGAVVEV
jgi:hypothetical protein